MEVREGVSEGGREGQKEGGREGGMEERWRGAGSERKEGERPSLQAPYTPPPPPHSREYALVGCIDGTSFVDVTEPMSPQVLGFLRTHTFSSLWRDIKVTL